jgi:LacI family transcriptional regulator
MKGQRTVAEALLDKPDRPTAVLAASDKIALGFMEEARRRSIRVPQDLSVVGFDDILLASRSVPPLTAVAQPLVEIGQVATRGGAICWFTLGVGCARTVSSPG